MPVARHVRRFLWLRNQLILPGGDGKIKGMRAKRKERPLQANREPPDPIRDAIRHGIDISMLRDNLARTPAERLRRHAIALNTAEMLRKARHL